MVIDALPTDQLYREQLLDHYRHPRNYGKLSEYSAQADGHNPLCGDAVQVQLQLSNGVVAKMHFTGQGCAISMAAASLLSEYVAGHPTVDVQQLGLPAIESLLNVKLPPARIKCGLLALEAVQAALR